MGTTEWAVSADGTRIAYDREGDGPVLVLVDGALVTRAMGPAKPLQAALAERFTVVAYDRRGRGESEDGDPAAYAPEREIEDLTAVIAAAGGPALVVGQSSGAALAFRAAAAGAPITRLVGFEAPWMGQRPGEDYRARVDDLVARDERGKAVSYFLVTMARAPGFVPFMLRVMGRPWRAMTAIAPTLRYDARVMGDFTVPADELGRVGIPALVLVGGRSPALMKQTQEAVAAAIPGARHDVLPGQTHQVTAAALAPAAAAFLAE